MKRSVILIVVAAALVAATAFAAPPAPRLAGRIDAAQTRFAPEEPVALTLHLANRGAGSVWVLRWQVPSEEIEADMLAVTRNGEPVEYLGPLVKRPAPTAADYVEIAAGEALSATFDPTSVYDMTAKGQYSVTFKSWQLDVLTGNPAVNDALPDFRKGKGVRRHVIPEVVDVQAVEFWFDGIDAGIAVEAQVIGGYTKCTTSQQSTLQTAHANAITYSNKAINYINANPGGSTLHAYWFGTYNSSRYSTTKSHYTAINLAFFNESAVTYDCGCKKPYYAYVYPTQPYKIYLCKVFWTAPTTGRDSKMGTLIHEMSHFNVVASTDDYVYGATGAHNLALTDPAKAIDNADNHEYFAEDQ
jgi:peptidyl-Lys metalloendopeptidase